MQVGICYNGSSDFKSPLTFSFFELDLSWFVDYVVNKTVDLDLVLFNTAGNLIVNYYIVWKHSL